MGVKRLRPLPVTVVEGDDFILVAQHLHADKTTEGGRIIQADYTDYGITIERIGTDKLSIYSLLNQTPLSDVVETTSRTAASLIDDELWDYGGDPPGHNVKVVFKVSNLSPSSMEGGRQYLFKLILDGGSTYGTETVRWIISVLSPDAV